MALAQRCKMVSTPLLQCSFNSQWIIEDIGRVVISVVEHTNLKPTHFINHQHMQVHETCYYGGSISPGYYQECMF